MSSHHFVKEGQEPALIIASPVNNIDEVGAFLEWAPQVIVLEDALDSVLLCGIKADTVVYSTREPDVLQKELSHQTPINLVKTSSKDDELMTALTSLITHRQYVVNILAEDALHYFDDLEEMADQIDASLIDGKVKWSLVKKSFKKWFPENTTIKIRGNSRVRVIEDSATIVNNELLTKSDGFLSLQAENPFWIGQLIN